MYTREARVERQTTACRANNSNLVIEVEPLSVVIVEVDWVGFASHLYHPCHEFAGCCRSCTTNSRSDAVLKSGECIQFQLNIQRNAARAATYFANRAASKPCASARRVDARRRRWGFFFISRQSPRVSFTFWQPWKVSGLSLPLVCGGGGGLDPPYKSPDTLPLGQIDFWPLRRIFQTHEHFLCVLLDIFCRRNIQFGPDVLLICIRFGRPGPKPVWINHFSSTRDQLMS